MFVIVLLNYVSFSACRGEIQLLLSSWRGFKDWVSSVTRWERKHCGSDEPRWCKWPYRSATWWRPRSGPPVPRWRRWWIGECRRNKRNCRPWPRTCETLIWPSSVCAWNPANTIPVPMQKGGSRINKWLNGKVERSCAYFAHASVRIEIQIGFQRFPRERRQLHQLLVQEQDPGHKLSIFNHFTSFQLAKIYFAAGGTWLGLFRIDDTNKTLPSSAIFSVNAWICKASCARAGSMWTRLNCGYWDRLKK